MGTVAENHWNTTTLLRPPASGEQRNALLILNSPLPLQPIFRRLWAAASVRFCADGGANRLYDRFVKGKDRAEEGWDAELDADEDSWLPDLVLGDLDSLRDDVRRYYEDKGVRVERDPDEFSTDLGKNVARLSRLEAASQPMPGGQYQLVIVGGLSGRLDQTIHTLHALTLLAEKEGRERVWAIGRESAAVLLAKGKHHLKIDLAAFGKTCGILPLGASEAYVTTTGLEWNLGPTDYMYPTSLATAVSTSNHLIQEDVTVETDVPVVWTMEVRGGGE
ncbi:thiamine diphosphokinase [Rhodotorula paludigena]|uniref:thiamine diphosphokinase n=1 Tax=Rhodotorula paludigena TaxID=86838 RepID=UPI0031703E9F